MVIDYNKAIKQLQEAQDSDREQRERSREQETCLYIRGGQWEQSVWERLANRPRYTIDLISPVVKQICADIKRSSFDIKVLPSSSGSGKETAELYEGVIRHIENISGARHVYGQAAKTMVECGIGGWRISNKYMHPDNFDQDLVIDTIHNFKDRVWFDPGCLAQDMSEAEYCFVLYPMIKAEYERRFPNGGGIGLGEDRMAQVMAYHKENVVVCEMLSRKQKKGEIILLSNGRVIADNDENRSIIDELEAFGIREVDRRQVDTPEVYSRFFDGSDWLDEETLTPFDYIPVVPCFGNYKVIENELIYFGEPEKLLDPQRVTNYTLSRLAEDTSLRAKSKLWMTAEQAAGHIDSYRTLNTDSRPVAFYNHKDGQLPPEYKQPAPPDPTLLTIMDATTGYINKISGQFAANMGDNPGLQSGVAIEQQIAQGNNASYDYMDAMEIAVRHTAKILIKAIPKIYGDRQLIRIVGQDGAADFAKAREVVTDRQTGRQVVINDLSQGQYDVVVTIGPGYQNQQQETRKAIVEIAQVDPTILQIGSDVLLNNISAPGLKDIAERKRRQMVLSGVIPENQLTEDEKALIQQQQAQGQQLNPMDQLALATAQAEVKKAEAQAADIMSKMQERQAKNELEIQKLTLDAQRMAMDGEQARHTMSLEIQTLMDQHYKTIAETLSAIKQAMGVDAVMSPQLMAAYAQTAEKLITRHGADDPRMVNASIKSGGEYDE